MLPPRYLAGLSDELVDIYSQLETDILRDMARRIARLGKASDMDRWQAQILAESGSLKADIEKKIRRYDKNVAAAVKAVVQEALDKNTQNDNKIFLDALGRTVSTPTAQEILATVQKCYSDLSRLTLTTAATSQEAFVREANRAVSKVRSGAFTYDAAIKTAVDDLADAGVTTVQYENGKPVRRSIESAVRMNILTGINQTAAQMTLNNCDAVECDLVETSAHLGARPEHEEWQGQIFSRSGKNPNYRPFSVCGLGSPTGICGINCRHSFYPYFEGMEKEYTEKELDQMASEKVTYNGKTFTRYEGEQALRSIERNIRLYKRVALTQDAAGLDNTKARQKIGEWQAKARDFTKQTGIERDSTREHVGNDIQPRFLKPPTAKPSATSIIEKTKIIEPEKPKIEYKTLTKEEFKEIKHPITKEEHSIVYGKFGMGGYIASTNAKHINECLRMKEELSDSQKKVVETLQNIIKRNNINENIIVTRNVDADALPYIAGVEWPQDDNKLKWQNAFTKLPGKIDKGRIFIEKGFMSTSGVAEKNVFTNRNVKLNIRVPEGTHAYKTTNIRESEIIFGLNTKLKILDSRVENVTSWPQRVILECEIVE
ncbi:MAG: hypothetical protein IJT92_03545 [Spirochaetia bacterium]|nr:hypothetical protein [Spirochaetia bacterium]MBR0318917.1 hypothetical protein [Spirochaetia bacterium]